MDEARELLLHVLDHFAQAEDLLHFLLRLLLVDIDYLQLASIASDPLFTFFKEFHLGGLCRVPCHVSQLSVLSDLVWVDGDVWYKFQYQVDTEAFVNWISNFNQ